MEEKIEQLKKLVERYRNEHRNPFGFVAKDQDYPVISEEELVALESEYDVSLPSEYRVVVTKIANGAFHPMCGTFTVRESLAVNRLNQEDAAMLSRPLIGYRYLYCCGLLEYNEFASKERIEEYEIRRFGRKAVLDDYLHPDIKTTDKYQEELLFKDYMEIKDVPDEYPESIYKHILVLSFEDYYRGEIGIVLDGKLKGEVVYIPSDFSSNINLTHMNYLDWLIGYYTHELDKLPGKYFSFW